MQQAYPQGGKDSHLVGVLEKCTEKFKADPQYKDNVRCVKKLNENVVLRRLAFLTRSFSKIPQGLAHLHRLLERSRGHICVLGS